MKKLYFLLLALMIVFGFSSDKPSSRALFVLPKGITEQDYQQNTLIIKIRAAKQTARVMANMKSSLSRSGVSISRIEAVFPNVEQEGNLLTNPTIVPGFSAENYFRVQYQGAMTIDKVINTLLKDAAIEYAEPSYIYSTVLVPNDPRYANQFFLPQVKAPQAWDILHDASGVIIGIVDTGSEITHEDLAANIYLNPQDPINGVDDDGDGYVDNYHGWDLCGAQAAAMVDDNDPNVKSAPADHGVHVSGIAAGVSNNMLGIASIAGNAKLLIVKAGPDDKATSIYKGYEGIKYAADHGAHIINCSWGGPGGGQFGQEMVNYAISKGCLVVAAAGNSANDTPLYPAAFEGVLAVANVEYNDVKGQYSNYGTYVDISAPGQGILSTTFNNSYTAYSGTSMAAPLVASAAALVKAKYPSMSGLEIGELLRVTADDIDSQNPNYQGLLGKGRLNVYRALTESGPSVRYQNLKIEDDGLGNRAKGTVFSVQFDLKNFLNTVNGLSVTLTANSPYVQILDGHLDVGALNHGESKSNIGPIRVKVLDNAPDNLAVIFTLSYTGNAGAYQDTEHFKLQVALDYLNVTVNEISTSFTSNGRVGYSRASAEGGLGFMYKGENMLYECALMIGKSSNQVSNNARYESGSNDDFNRLQTAALVAGSEAAFEAKSVFADQNSANPIGLELSSKLLAFNETGRNKFVIVEYEIENKGANDLEGIYPGLFTDWDLDDAAFNATEWNTDVQMAYVYAKKNSAYPYAGIVLLNPKALPSYYPMSYQVANDPQQDGKFTTAEKYTSLSSGIKSQGLGHDIANGYDVMFTVGSGPYRIAKQKKIKVAYAFVAGDNLDDLLVAAKQAKLAYNEWLSKEVPASFFLMQNYPNAAKDYTTISFGLPQKALVQLSLYDVSGRRLQKWIDREYAAGSYEYKASVFGLRSGVYIYELKAGNQRLQRKMLVVK